MAEQPGHDPNRAPDGRREPHRERPLPSADSVPATVIGEVPAELRGGAIPTSPTPPASAWDPIPVSERPAQAPPSSAGASPPTIVGTVGSTYPAAAPYAAPSQPPPAAPSYPPRQAPAPFGGPPRAAPPPAAYPPPQQNYQPPGYALQPNPTWQASGPSAVDQVREFMLKAGGVAGFHAVRANSRNLRGVEPDAAELPVLSARHVTDRTVQQYLVWRRSWLLFLLPLAGFSVVFHLWSVLEADFEAFTAFGAFVLVAMTLVQALGFPVAAGVAAWKWDHLVLSRWVLAGGFVASFILPFMSALIPIHVFLKIEADSPEEMAGAKIGAGMVGAMMYVFTLLPAVLAMIPGVLRACVRIKSLLPESIVPGWFLVLSAPYYALILLLVFILVNQVAGNFLLIGGVLLLMAAPLVYLWKTPLFVRPLAGDNERRRELELLQLVYMGAVALAMLMLLLYVLTLEVMGRPLVGHMDRADPDMRGFVSTGRVIWEAFKFVVGYTARSMFITAVAMDLFMMINLSVWRNTKTFEQTEASKEYDELMTAFGDVSEPTAGR